MLSRQGRDVLCVLRLLTCSGYDPAAMQQYYQQAQAHALAAAGAAANTGEAGAETSAAAASATAAGVYQMPGMDPSAAASMDPNQAAAAAAAAAAHAHAAYYAQYAPWAAAQGMDMSQVRCRYC